MTKKEIEILKDLLECEIFHLEGVVNTLDSKVSNKYLQSFKSILETVQVGDDSVNDNLNKSQKQMLLFLVKQAQTEAQRVLIKQEAIRKIQKDSEILNKLEQSLSVA